MLCTICFFSLFSVTANQVWIQWREKVCIFLSALLSHFLSKVAMSRVHTFFNINSCPTEPGYTMPLQTVGGGGGGGGGGGWSGVAKVSCILCHRGVQLILAYSWAGPGILVAGKSRGGMFFLFCFFTFIPVPLSSLSISFISSAVSSISFLPFSGRRHKMTHKGWHVINSCPLVLLNPDISCLCKQCRSRSVGFWRSQLIWICTVCH